MFAYRKIKRGSIIKVRDYLPANKGTKYKIPKEFNLETDVPEGSFSEEVLSCLPKEGREWKIPEEELRSRLDLRSINVCSVDPPGCTDIDDALHYRELGNNVCEVGVHIADVSYFVRPNTSLDHEAADRGTTVYLCDRRIDMIPDLLSSNLCSLIQHQDRLAFSAIWKMSKDTAEVLEVKFARSIINSKASLTYEKAQEMIDDKSQNGAIHKSLRGLNELAKKLKAKRLERGALVLARADEIRFIEVESETFDCDSSLEIQHKRMVETNSMVEEFMLLANISVANKLLESYPEQALLRRHPKPSKTNFQDLIESARVKGFEILPDDGKSLSNSLDKAQLESDYYFNLMLRMIATRCMTPAAYFCSGCFDPQVVSFSHFGLAADLYTHFTSPIRRYADLLVHRLLACAIGSETLDKSMQNKEHIQMLCDQINYRHRMAQLASRASTRYHTILYMKSKQELVEDAYVFSIRQNDIQVLIPRLAFQYNYALQPNYAWLYNVDERTQKNIHHNVVLKQFDRLKVHISFSSREDLSLVNRLQIKIIEPRIDMPDEASDTDVAMKVLDSDVQDQIMSDAGNKSKKGGDWNYEEIKKKIRLGLDGKKSAKPVIVVPGDSLDKYIKQDTTILGPGLMRIYDMVVATKSGILKWRNNNLFWVDSHQKRYVAARGECVIGVVRSKGSLHARVDINSAELATLSLLAFEGANKRNKPNLNVGDLIYAKVLSASKHVETELVCVNSNGKRDGLGVIGDKGGVLISLSIDTVRILLSPRCDLLEKLGQVHRYEIALGMNGRVWINSNDTSTIVQVADVLRKFDLE
jgi:VacB/RNase II family 3'-5' exoribonuclease